MFKNNENPSGKTSDIFDKFQRNCVHKPFRKFNGHNKYDNNNNNN